MRILALPRLERDLYGVRHLHNRGELARHFLEVDGKRTNLGYDQTMNAYCWADRPAASTVERALDRAKGVLVFAHLQRVALRLVGHSGNYERRL